MIATIRSALVLATLLSIGSLFVPSAAAVPGRWLGPDGKPLPFASEGEILEYLRSARVVATERLDAGINRPVKLTLERDSITVHAIFRTVDRVLSDGRISRFSMLANLPMGVDSPCRRF